MTLTKENIVTYPECIALTNVAAVFNVEIFIKTENNFGSSIGKCNVIVNFLTKKMSCVFYMNPEIEYNDKVISTFICNQCYERCNPLY